MHVMNNDKGTDKSRKYMVSGSTRESCEQAQFITGISKR